MAMVSVLHQSPVLMEQLSHRTPPRKPFYLRSDGMRSVTGVPASVKAARRSTTGDSFDSYDLKTARRRVASVCLAVSPRDQSQIRYCDVMAVDSDAWSSDEETTALDLRAARRKGRSLSWMFPLPPQAPKLSDKPAQLDLKLEGLSGLGLDGIATYSLTSIDPDAPLNADSASTSPQTSESSLESQAGHRNYYDSDGLIGSQGWSPSTCADSVFPSPSLDQEDDAEEGEFNTSIVTRPLSICKASARSSSSLFRDEEEESDEYCEPLYSSEDQQKMERLRSSLTLLEFDSPVVQVEEVEIVQQDYDLTHLAPPSAQTDLRMIYSPEHGAPSLAEQLAFACGNGYRYNVAESFSHYDSAVEYLPQWIRPQTIEMSPAPSLDPFSGLRAETGDSWSEAHGGDMDDRLSLYSPDGARLSRGPSLLGRYHHEATSTQSAEDEPASPVGSISSGSDSFKSSRSSIALSSATAHTCYSDSLEAVKEVSVEQLSQAENEASAGALKQSIQDDDVGRSANGSPGTEALAEFSYMTLLNDLVPSTPLPLSFESQCFGLLSPPLSTSEVELEMQTHGSTLEPLSDLPSPTEESFPVGSLPFNNSSSMASIHSQLLSSASLADGLSSRADFEGSSSMVRSQSSTSILDRGRPIRGGTSFLPQRAGVARVQQTLPPPRQPSAAKVNIPKRISSRGRLAQHADEKESIDQPKKVKEWVSKVSAEAKTSTVTPVDTSAPKPVARLVAPTHSRQSSNASIPSSLIPGQGHASQRPFKPGHRTVSSTSRASPLPMSRDSSRPGIDLLATNRPRVLSDEAYEGLQQAMKEAQAARSKKQHLDQSSARGMMTSSQSMPAGLAVNQSYRGQPHHHLRFKDQASAPATPSKCKEQPQPSDYSSKARPVMAGSQSMVQLPSVVQSARQGLPSSSSSKSVKMELPAQPERAQSLPQLPQKPSRPTIFARDQQAAPLPTLFTARSASQRFRGDTGIPETQPDLRRLALQARDGPRQRNQFGGGIVSTVVRWGHARALRKEEIKTQTPGGCVLVVEEHQSTTEKVVLI